MFGSPSVSSLSFQSVAATLGDSPFGKKAQDKSSGFVGSGSQLFAPHQTDDSNDDNEDGDPQDGPHFEPIIPLPDKIEVKTGEENEEVMFSHRAKLYRYVTEEKQWKERGVGDIKLLRNTFTGKIRVLMRREQVLKICANHQITTDMKLQPNASSERSWVWSTAADFSEEECKAERLAVKFKNEEIAKQFKETFEECQEILKNQVSLKVPVQEENKEDKPKEQVDILAKFRPAEGSWECDMCFLRNGSDKMQCAACSNLKPGVKIQEAKTSENAGSGAASSGAGLSFSSGGLLSSEGFSFVSGAKFRPAEGSWECDMCFLRNGSDKMQCAACSNLKPGVKIQEAKTSENAGSGAASSGAGLSFSSGGLLSSEGFSFVSGAKFRPAEGSWECDMCFLRNGSDKMQCAACINPKPGAETIQNKISSEKPQLPFGFGAISSGSGITFGSFAPSSDSTAALGSVAKFSNSGFAFGSAAPGSNSGSVFAPSLGSEITFGLGPGGFKFGFGGETAETKPFNSSFENLSTRLKQDGSATEAETKEYEKDDSKACEESVEEEVNLEEASGGATAGGSKKEDTEPATGR